jgi:hypothetical protein
MARQAHSKLTSEELLPVNFKRTFINSRKYTSCSRAPQFCESLDTAPSYYGSTQRSRAAQRRLCLLFPQTTLQLIRSFVSQNSIKS